jgi:hypothetical protein
MAVISVTVKDKNGLTATATATATVTGGINDGSQNAPAGVAPQRPTLLDAYQISRRPTWQVAGVHYGVGYPAGTVLKNPATISIPGASISGKSVNVTGANVILDGYDFTGWNIFVRGANTKIRNSKFLVSGGNLETPVMMYQGATNLYVGYCVIDGNNVSPNLYGGLITWMGSGVIVEYCWLKNSGGDIFQSQGGNGGNITLRYNLLEQAGMESGSHGDYLQVFGIDNPTVIVDFNTAFENGGATQGFIVENARNGSMSNNTFVGDVSFPLGLESAPLTGTFTIRDNYFAGSKFGFAHNWSGGCQPGDSNPFSVFIHNVNMGTGAIIQD